MTKPNAKTLLENLRSARQAVQDQYQQVQEGLAQDPVEENLHQWFKEKWVRFGPDGKIRGDCARGSDSEGKPKCLPQSKAHALGKKGRASAAARKRREDPDADRSGPAKNVATKKKTTEAIDHSQLDEKCWDTHRQAGMKRKGDRMVPNCVPKESQEQCPECGGAMYPDTMINEKKDACYYKVKSRYKVWPSAYASGALVKCRKKGAKNWGNKSESAEQRFSEPLTGYHIVYRKTGNPVINTPSFETKDQAQKYLMTKMFANHQDYKVVHTADVGLQENWSEKYKRSINCNNPKGFSQRAHCQGRAKNEAANPAQQAAIAINMKKHHQKPKNEGVAEGSSDNNAVIYDNGYVKIDGKMYKAKRMNHESGLGIVIQTPTKMYFSPIENEYEMPSVTIHRALKMGGLNPVFNEGVAEEVMVEISSDTLKSYQQKVSNDAMKHKMDPTKRSPEKANRSISGFSKAQKRLEKGVAEGFEPGHREIERWATQSEENQKIYNAYIKAGKMADEAYKQNDGASYTGLQLRQKQIRDLIAKKMSEQGVAESSWDDKIHYGVNYHEPLEPGDKITWYHSNHYPEIKGTVVGWKDGHLIVKSVDPSPRNTEKTVVRYRVPKNNILSHTKQGVAEMNVGKRKPQPDTYHIVNKDGTPTSLMCYLDKDNAIKDRDAKHKGAEVHQVGPRGKVKGVAEGYSNTTFNVDRRKLNVPALIQKGAILVTHPHGEQGWETDDKEDWAFSLLSLYNVLQGGWPSEAKKYLKPQSYKRAEQQINSSAPNLGSDKLVYDGKYNQILWSIKKLGIPDNVAFLDKGQQGVAEMNVGKRKPQPDTYHIVNKDGTPTSLMCYLDKDNAIKDRDAKHKGAEVHQVGPRGKVKGVAEGLISQADEFRVELDDDGQVHLLDGENTIRVSMPLDIWKKMAGKKGRTDEFSVEVDNGQVHLLDGEGTIRVSMPVNVWKQLGKQGVAEGLNEFAPPGGDDGDDGFSEETLKIMAAHWWNGDQDPGIEKTLAAAGWEIGQDEGYDNGGVFVVQAGDVNGNSYISWPAEELEGLAEAYPNQQISRYNPDGKTYRGTSNKMPTLDPEDPVDNAIRFGPEHDQSYEQNFDKEELKRVAAKAISSLPKREQQVIKLHIWYGLSFEEIGKRLGVTKDRIRQIEARALRMLKHPERSSDLKSFAQEDTHTAGMAEAKRQPETFGGYDPDDFQEKLQRLKALAGAGPLKTVRDPETGRTRNVPAKPNK